MRKISSLTLAKTMAGLLLIAALGGGTAYAASAVAHNGLLDQQEAEDFAFMDADVRANEVAKLRTHLEKDKGVYIYDIEFDVGTIEYEYEIRAKDGVVLEKNKEDKSGELQADAAGKTGQTEPEAVSGKEETGSGNAEQIREGSPAPAEPAPAEKEPLRKTEDAAPRNSADAAPKKNADAPAAAKAVKEPKEAVENKYISVDSAKQIALRHAGFEEKDVKFTTAKFEDDNNRKEYDIEFYCGSLEYEYEIDAVTGQILDADVENDDD